MYFNKRKTQNIQKSNLILEQRYLKEQAPPPPPPADPAAPSSSTTRTPIKPMVKSSGPKSIKGKDGKVIEWKNQTEDQKKNVATKCGHKSVDEYEKSEWKCMVQEVK
jgi:hypothetical protein